MDKSTDFYSYDNTNYYSNIADPIFNPMLQYEQSYMYYRSLCMQLEYKIKCKEYENLCNSSNYRSDKKNEQPRIW